ncbi:MAG: M1 family metallopeptidase [Chitinophagales bacterium]
MKRTGILLTAILTVNLPLYIIAQSTSYWQQNVDYEINVTLDDNKHELTGSMAMRYQNNSPDDLSFIWIHLWPNAYKNNHTAFAKQKVASGSTDFQYAKDADRGYIDGFDFMVGGETVKLIYDEENPDIAKLILNQPVKSGETINIKTTFHVKIPLCFSRMGHDGQQYQLTQWFPKPAVYDRFGWHPIPYLDQGEFYSEFGNFHVYITVPDNYIVGASGDLLTKSEVEKLDQLAAETPKKNFVAKDMAFPPSSSQTKTLEYRLENAHDFAWFADKRFNVIKSEITLPESERIVKTYAYFTNKHAGQWLQACNYIDRAVLFYSDKVGEYPWNVAQAVDGALGVGSAGGMEYPTITVISGSYGASELDNVITHEVGHNWFYGILGSNERDHPWMDEGINSYYENRYMDEYYGTRDLLGIPPKISSLLGIDTSSSDNVIWNATQITSRQNKSQPINLSSNDYTFINYGLEVYSRPAYFLRYIADWLGQEEFDRIMRKYYKTYEFKHVYPDDMQRIFEEETGENFSWFFEKLINSDRGPDYKISNFQKGKTAMAVDVENKSEIPAPFSISIMDEDSILRTDWFRGHTGNQTIYFNYKPEWHITHFTIDAQRTVPETERENNTIKTSGLFKTIEPLQLKLLGFGVDDPTRTTISYSPIIGWNNNDRWMPGIAVWNTTLPVPFIDYVFAPMYSIYTKSLVGQGSIGINYYPDNGFFDRMRLSEFVSSYTYDEFSYDSFEEHQSFTPQYRKFQTKLELDVRKKQFNSKLKHAFEVRNIIIQEDDIYFYLDPLGGIVDTDPRQYMVNEFAYELNNKNTIFPYSLRAVAEFGEGYNKIYTEFNFRACYPKKKYGVDLRIFAGKMSITASEADYGKHEFTVSGNNGYFDDLYDEIYLGRNDAQGKLANQLSMTDGFLKIPHLGGTLGQTYENLLAANLEVAVPFDLPIALFADVAMNSTAVPSGDNPLLYDAGVMLRLPNNFFEVYFPLLWSDEIEEQIGFRPYSEKISFMANFDLVNVFELMRKLEF